MKKIVLMVLFMLYPLTAFAAQNKLTETQVAHVLQKAGFKKREVPIMTCIAKYESSFNPKAVHRNTNKTYDFGLLQINDVWLKECKVSANGLKDPYQNAKCGAKVYHEQGFQAWSTFKKFRRTCLAYKIQPTKPNPDYIVSTQL